jgi:hypothetical protein
MKIEDLDVVYISFDEPNAEYNYANLVSKFPWAKRVHGVKGFDAAHKAACDLSETDYVVTVDGDTIVDTRFFKVNIDLDNYRPNTVFSYNGVNNINGLVYGNGGVKVWPKSVLQTMRTHEASDTYKTRVDFCWEDFYYQFPNIYSITVQNGSAYQAFRSGFREGVKLSLINGTRVSADQLEEKQWPVNIKRLKIWMTVGADVEYGEYSTYGAKLGFYKTTCTDWDYTLISDYDWFYDFWKTVEFKNDKMELTNKVKAATGWDLPYLNAEASRLVKQVHFDSNK